jgi:RNA polymerase sigma-70 factor (ECF subfamily)
MLTGVDVDHELLTALRQHQSTAAEALIAAYGGRAYRLAVRITGNRHDAEEVVQDAFWNVVRKIDTFRGESSLRSWIYRITANAAYQKVRGGAHRRRDISLEEVLPRFDEDGHHADLIGDWAAEIDDPTIQHELRIALTSALEDLPDHYRAVIILRDVEGLPNAEIADALRITIPTAKTRAHRARLFLRKRLSIFMAGAGGSVEESAQQERVPGCA